MAAATINLPDFLANWPWKRQINPHYDEARADCEAWAHGFGLFVDEKSQKRFDRCQTPKLGMLSYPYMSKEQARSGCDLMLFFYVFDEITDVMDAKNTQYMADIVMDAVRNPGKQRPADEPPLGELARQYWVRASRTATPMCQNHFIETMQMYLDGVVQQSQDRADERVRSIDDFWDIRRNSSGCLPSFALIEMGLHFPEGIYRHPLMEQLRDWANLSISTTNDVYSYNLERARGHDLHNIITCVMHEKDLGLQEAIDWLGVWHEEEVVGGFRKAERELRELSQAWPDHVAREIEFYINGLGCWVRGSDSWHFEGERHFGVQGLAIQKTRQVVMLPRLSLSRRANEAEKEADGNVGVIRDMLERDSAAGLDIMTKE